MKKNKIEGVRPFNDLYFRSCYYHQLLAGLNAFNIDKDEVLLGFFYEALDDFGIKEINFNDNKGFIKSLNYSIKLCNLNKKQLIKWIDKGNPVILGVDDYYLESKDVTYLKVHEPHFILAYGYDLDKDEVNIIEHDYFNDYNYKEKIISFSNLLLANKKFKHISKKRKRCRVLLRQIPTINNNIWNFITPIILRNNMTNITKNLVKLKNILSFDLEYILKITDNLSNYIFKLKEQYHIFSRTNLLKDNGQILNILSKIIINYSTIQSVIWKTNYMKNTSYLSKYKDKIITKIEELLTLEKELYTYLIEVSLNAN